MAAGIAAGIAAAIAGCGAPIEKTSSPRGQASAAPTTAAKSAPKPRRLYFDPSRYAALVADVSPETDYVAVGPRALLAAIEPLLAHRAATGHHVARLAVEDLMARRPEGEEPGFAISAGIKMVAAKSGTKLRFVLLVGDAPGPHEEASDFVPLPTFYLPKVPYSVSSDGGSSGPRYGTPEAPGDPYAWGRSFPSDMPYGYANRNAPGHPELDAKISPAMLAVGRVPARTPAEASGFAQKAVSYETAKAEGAWRRRLELIGGPANFGPVADYFIESTATRALDDDVPYDFDVRVAFMKLESPYVVPYPEARQRVWGDLSAGALIAAYAGHGASTSFAYIRHGYHYYAVGTSEDAETVRIPEGKPFFLSITCSTGEFDLPSNRRSLAEAMVMNPDGPIAVFASSRESHPYPNALYGQAFVESFLQQRAPTIGEGVLDMKERMTEGRIPLAPFLFENDPKTLAIEHEGLYNLFGDPATRLRYPSVVDVTVAGGAEEAAPGASLTVSVDAKGLPSGTAELTLETRRSVIRGALVPPDKLKAMRDEDAWRAMDQNYALASDKVITRLTKPVSEGQASFVVKLPKVAGDYELKALVAGGGEAAAGHRRIRVAPAARR